MTPPARVFSLAVLLVGAACASKQQPASAPEARIAAPVVADPSEPAVQIGDRECAAGSFLMGRGHRNAGDAKALSLHRVPVRTQSMRQNWSGWRLELASERGPGAILFVETPSGSCYVGQGVFAGWPQPDLAAAYRKYAPNPETVVADMLQLG